MGRRKQCDGTPPIKPSRPPPTPKTRKHTAKPPPTRPPRPRNSLIPYISTKTALGQHVLKHIEDDGYCILPSILSQEECDEEYDRLWDFVEATSPGVKRSDPDSWYPDKHATVPFCSDETGDVDNNTAIDASTSTPPDPWPHSGWVNLPDMCQSYQSGWLFSDLREKLATRIFEPIYGTRLLHSSKEGFTFHRPTYPSVVSDPSRFAHPCIGRKRPRVAGKEQKRTNGDHFDQRAVDVGLQCIQSSTALRDQEVDKDGCFMCWPGSHRMHPKLTKDLWRARSDWVPLTDGECDMLREEGYAPRRVPVKAGDVILWRSDLCHCGAGPLGPVNTFRAVSYTCMLPAMMTEQGEDNNNAEEENEENNILLGSEAMLARKFGEYSSMQTGDHRPDLASMPHMQAPKSSGVELMQPYFKDGPPQLTWRQAELYGLVPYVVENKIDDEGEDGCNINDSAERLRERERQRAIQRGVRFRDECRAESEGEAKAIVTLVA